MVSIHSVATELRDQAINLFRYGYKEVASAAVLFYDLADLNKGDVDWKNIKPKMTKVKVNMNLDGWVKWKVTWQEVDLKDQVMEVASVTDGDTFVLNVVWPISFKRWEKLYNVDDNVQYVITADASTATAGATTLTVDVDSTTGAAAWESIRLLWYSKPYNANEGNSFDADQYSELYNLYQRVNMAIDFDQAEVNTMKIQFNTIWEYLKYKVGEASRRMLRGIMRDFYKASRGTTSIWGNTAYTAWGIDYFIRNESGVAWLNLGTGSWAGTWEININGADTAARRVALFDAIERIYRSGLPNLRAPNNLIFFCTSSFMREIEELFYDKLVVNDTLDKIGITVSTINFLWMPVSFMVDNVLDDLETKYDWTIKKVCYSIPVNYLGMHLLANDVPTKWWTTVTKFGYGKIFVPSQTTEEQSDIRLYTVISYSFWGIKSGAYRKLNLQW